MGVLSDIGVFASIWIHARTPPGVGGAQLWGGWWVGVSVRWLSLLSIPVTGPLPRWTPLSRRVSTVSIQIAYTSLWIPGTRQKLVQYLSPHVGSFACVLHHAAVWLEPVGDAVDSLGRLAGGDSI